MLLNILVGLKFKQKMIKIFKLREGQLVQKSHYLFIIKQQGCNMKQIIDRCSKEQVSNSCQYDSFDVVKLRLRGKGSGHLEGPEKQGSYFKKQFIPESEEPMHLCVSSKYESTYSLAINLVTELLENIYNEFKVYCAKNKKFQENLKIKNSLNSPIYQTSTNYPTTTNLYPNWNLSQKSQIQFPQKQFYSFQQQLQQQQIIYCQPQYYQPLSYSKLNLVPLSDKYSPEKSLETLFNFNELERQQELTKETIEKLVEARNFARRQLDFQLADKIRNFLKSKQILLIDEKGGRGKGIEVTTWKYITKENFIN